MLGLHQRSTTRYLETKEDREAIRKADDAEFGPRVPKSKGEPDIETTTFTVDVEEEPEFESLEAFAEFCMDDERDSFTFSDLMKLQIALRVSGTTVIRELEGYGLKYEGRPRERTTRGFTSNSHNLYQGNPMSGGSGFTNDGPGSVRR
jgi:hypothetical protein